MARHAAAWWAERVEEMSRGGDGEEIARRHGVRLRTLIWWRSELARRARQAGSAYEARPQLLPVVVARAARREHQATSATATIKVVVDVGGTRITARGDLQPEHLAAMIAAARPC